MTPIFTRKKFVIIFTIVCVLFIGYILFIRNQCFQKGSDININSTDIYFPYDLENPDKSYKLPNILKEISGMSFYKKNKLACIQDEKFQLFIYDLNEGEVSSKYKLGTTGDFEGVEICAEKLFMLKSNGKLSVIENYKENSYKQKSFKTPLSKRNNCEGLCYDSISNSLLIACKAVPYIDKKESYEGFKAVYQFNLAKERLEKTPFLLIDLNKIQDLKNLSWQERFSFKMARVLNISGDIRFQPSGIAIHPLTGHIYIISSVGKSLIIIDRKGNIKAIKKISNKLFQKPEGICFDPNGDLFISNEANGGKANILKFILLQRD